jgi:hypothetical protein
VAGVDVVLDVGVGGATTTVRAVAHPALVPQLAPSGAAAVATLLPAGAVVSTATWKEAVATEVGVPGAPSAGVVQVSVLVFGSIVMACLARSATVLVTVACPRSPDRSSTTVPPEGRTDRLLALSV